jgi:hypothetical protein
MTIKNSQYIETSITTIYLDCLAYEEVAEVVASFEEQLLLFCQLNEYDMDAEALQAFTRCQTTFRTIRATYGSIDAFQNKHMEELSINLPM